MSTTMLKRRQGALERNAAEHKDVGGEDTQLPLRGSAIETTLDCCQEVLT